MKAKPLRELFPAAATAASGILLRDFLKTGHNGVRKGIVIEALECLP